jgi:cellobiose phosphorylase
MEYVDVYQLAGDSGKADKLNMICEKIKTDFNKFLVKNSVVAGYGLVEKDGSISLLLHPNDSITGIHYSILPMERGILSGIFTQKQAFHHLQLIEQHLKGPDGARLMDRPLKYKGGIQEIFQRGESSTFFGREIGLMYVHEHIRYAEAVARMGMADEFVKALRQAIPVGYKDIVHQGDIRQANCYYSSSDVHFKNRYEADEHYGDVISGKIMLRGGWRVYSSGPGIFIGTIISRFLGLRITSENVIIDPVIPQDMDGLSVFTKFLGNNITFIFRIEHNNHSPKSISINGATVEIIYEDNKYRKGGAIIPKELFLQLLSKQNNLVEVKL